MSRCHTLGSSPIISTFIANNLSPMMNLAEQLRDWADRTANFYHDIATSDPDCDLPFYTQSDLSQVRQRPKLLILAINPGSDGSYRYQDQLASKDWRIKGGLHGNRMTGDVLLRGNWYFREERNKWRIWTMLRSILRYAGVDIDSLLDGENVKLVFSEVVLFSTPRAVGIETVVRRHDCHKRCEALIEILQPKRILCLGAQKWFRHLSIENQRELIPSELRLGTIGANRIPVFGIPHPSKPRFSSCEMEMIGACLGYLFEYDDVEAITPKLLAEQCSTKIEAWQQQRAKNRKATRVNQIDTQDLIAAIEAADFKLLGKCKNGRWFEYGLTDELLFRMVLSGNEGQYLGIRARRRAKGAHYNADLARKDAYLRSLSALGWLEAEAQSWLGRKRVNGFDKAEEIIAELRKAREILTAYDEIAAH